ncbi:MULTISPECIES: hypothetical protein [Bacillaceae]|uniref:hypothetical protein n=1 Tax=Bacillaceae TaxID=186817 RepID=UPI000AE8E0A9|nr:hypothetical protein [Bacillus rubiinfantis]
MTQYRVTPELNQLFSLLNNGKELADAVSHHLDKEEQGRMYDIVKDVLSDEVALILEVEIRRKAFKETHGSEPYTGNRMVGEFN